MSAAHNTKEWHAFRRIQRARWQKLIDASGVACRRCRVLIRKDQRWQLGHIIDVRLGGALTDPGNVWPEHPRCNAQGGARLSHAIRYAKRTRDEREPGW